MPFATWWRGDPWPDLAPLSALSVQRSLDVPLIARLMKQPARVIEARIQAGNHFYMAAMDDEPAAYGWVATRKSGIAELHFSFTISVHAALYLWDFLTLPQWRGRGIYPRLLQAIIAQERAIEQFWIGFAPGNDASEHGIKKAGFEVVGDYVVTPDSRIRGLTLFHASAHARASSAFFNLPVLDAKT